DRAPTYIPAIAVAAAWHQIGEADRVHLGEIHLSAFQPDAARRCEFLFELPGFHSIDWLRDTRPERDDLVDIQPDPALLRDGVFKRETLELIAAICMLAEQPCAVRQFDDRVDNVQAGRSHLPANLAKAAQINVVVFVAQGDGIRLFSRPRKEVRALDK